MRKSLIQCVAAAVLLALVATTGPSASAAPRKARTSSSFGLTSSGGEAALGTVTSTHARCVKNRRVNLFLIRPGKPRKLVGVDRRTGRPAGNGDGYWVIETNLRPGRAYVAVVTRRQVGRILCLKYTTSRVRYSG